MRAHCTFIFMCHFKAAGLGQYRYPASGHYLSFILTKHVVCKLQTRINTRKFTLCVENFDRKLFIKCLLYVYILSRYPPNNPAPFEYKHLKKLWTIISLYGPIESEFYQFQHQKKEVTFKKSWTLIGCLVARRLSWRHVLINACMCGPRTRMNT